MNTVSKGDKLELAIFESFSDDITNGRFLAQKECCKIFTKKGYYSKDREKDIIFDVSIEIYLPGQETYSMLVLIECKNYKHKVPVDDVEEFYAKTQQISGANIKAIVASTNSYQDGAFKFSRSKGIGLLRYFSAENREWILTRSPSTIVGRSLRETQHATVSQGLVVQEFKSKGFDFYFYSGCSFTNSTHLFFSELLLSNLAETEKDALNSISTDGYTPYPSVEYMDLSVIEQKSFEVLDSINYFDGPVSKEKLVELVAKEYGLSLTFNVELPDGVLGNIDFEKSVVNIDNFQCESEARARFTLAHELGHFFLNHALFMVGESCYESHLSDECEGISLTDIMRMEWQANQFASCLLLPKKAFIKSFLEQAKIRGIANRGFGPLFVDGQSCNIAALNLLTSSLMKIFGVSKTVVIIRLKQLGIMQEPAATD